MLRMGYANLMRKKKNEWLQKFYTEDYLYLNGSIEDGALAPAMK